MWKTNLQQKALEYTSRRGLVLLSPPLGDGTEGSVWKATSKQNGGRRAIKVHRLRAAYLRECAVYERLAEERVTRVHGAKVPKMLHFDDDFLAIEMTIVTRPFVLDFASAWLDVPPDFTPEVWAEREEHWRELFGGHWPRVLAIRQAFEAMGIFLTDLHRGNLALD